MKLSAIIAATIALSAPARAQTAGSSALTRIGAAGAVRGKVQATAPNTAVGRIIESGKTLFLNDHVLTDPLGHLQVLLLDETIFTLGPDADMVLDTFVYDPKTSSGQVAAQVVKGAFRFVTGKVARAHPENMKVRLHEGTIGIRGTVVLGETGPNGSTVINAGAGPSNNADERPSAIDVSNAGVDRMVDQTGEGVHYGPGQAPSFPADMTAEIARISGVLEIAPKTPAGNDPAQGSTDKNSGQLTALAKELALDAAQEMQTQNYLDSRSEQAAQDSALAFNGIATWDQILNTLTSGQGVYNANGAFTQTVQFGSPVNIAGTWDFSATVNFAQRNISGSAFANAGSITDSVGISQSYAGLTGPATFTQNSTFGHYSFTFINNGQVAGQLQGSLNYNDTSSNNRGTGATLTATKQ